jgi:hypothetical protein
MAAVHFIHIGKTGGTAIKGALKAAGRPKTRYGKPLLHPHRYRLADVPDEDYAFFVMRDPVARFVSAFYSRLRRGYPRYNFEWTPAEEEVFQIFKTPQDLAAGLGAPDPSQRDAARGAMRSIRHVRRKVAFWLGTPRTFQRRLPKIVYIARQETLTHEWPQMKDVLGLPSDLELPTEAVAAHKGDYSAEDRSLTEEAERALVRWYAEDYRLLEMCERIRQERGWSPALEHATRR